MSALNPRRAVDTASPDSETTVRHFYEALNTGDTRLLDEALAPDWEAVPPLRTGPGREGWKVSIDHLRSVFSQLTVTIEDIIVSDDRAAARTVNRGVHSAELIGVPATGRELEFRACDMHQLRDGLIVRSWHLEDYFAIANQLGLQFSLPAE